MKVSVKRMYLYCFSLLIAVFAAGCKWLPPIIANSLSPDENPQESIEVSMPISETEQPVTQLPEIESLELPPSEHEIAEPWQDAYAEYLRGFETYEYRERDYLVPGSYSMLPMFDLCDIDSDGIPELLLIHDDGNWEDVRCDVYSYKNDAILSLGDIKCDLFGVLGVPCYYTEGIFIDVSYKGHYGIEYYYTIENGEIIERLVREYDNGSDSDVEPYSTIYIYDNNDEVRTITVNELEYEGGNDEYDESYEKLGWKILDFYKLFEENILAILYNRPITDVNIPTTG